MTSVLVTGVGGGVGQSIVKSLQDTLYTVVGVDGEPLGTGLYAVEHAYLVPYASKPGYVDRVIEIARRHGCALLFPGLDAELGVLAQAAERLRAAGVLPVVSSPEVVAICDDKLATYHFLTGNGFRAPMTLPLTEDITPLGLPVVLKPKRGGARSRGVVVVRTPDDLAYWLSTLDPAAYVAQEYLDSPEYTCGSVTFDGRCYGTIVMRRVLRDGDTYKAFVESNPRIHAHVRAVAEALRPFGPCNFQLRLRDGEPVIFEINARCSGTTYSRALAGFNEPLMVGDYLLRGRPPTYAIREIAILRYWKELPVDNSRIETLQEHGMLAGDGTQL